MPARALLVALALAAALALAPAALADGGPDPGVQFGGGSGVAAAGGGIRFVAVQAGGRTALEEIATHGGEVVRSAILPGSFGVPLVDFGGDSGGLSRNGRVLVLGTTAAGTCTPQGCLRRSSSFEVVDAKTLRLRSTLTLPGDFAFDALSPDGRRLYLIQHVSEKNAQRYVVRAYDLRRRELLPGRIADRTQRGWVMEGLPIARATSAGGRFVYTLYQNSGGYPFVHALDAAAGSAHCVGIPWPWASNQPDALRLSADGRRLEIGKKQGDFPDRMSFALDTRTYRVTALPAPGGGGFPWWTLALLPLALVPAAFAYAYVSRRSGGGVPVLPV